MLLTVKHVLNVSVEHFKFVVFSLKWQQVAIFSENE